MVYEVTNFDVLNDAFFSTRDTGAASNFSSNSFEIRRNGKVMQTIKMGT